MIREPFSRADGV